MSWLPSISGYFALCVLLGFGVIAIPLSLFWKRLDQTSGLAVPLILLFGMAVLGACAGFAGGMSRTGVVGDVIPAMFGLLGGVAAYLFGIDTSRGTIASIASACLALSLFISYAFGSQIRNVGYDHRELRKLCAQAYMDSNLLSNQDAFQRFEVRYKAYCDRAWAWHVSGPSKDAVQTPP